MRILTSYYAKVRDIDTSKCVLIRISASQPQWFTNKIYPCADLYPSWELINGIKNGEITEEEYMAEYSMIFTDQNKDAILDGIKHVCELEGVDVAILVCWEGIGKFCHRHGAGAWLDPNCVEYVDGMLDNI